MNDWNSHYFFLNIKTKRLNEEPLPSLETFYLSLIHEEKGQILQSPLNPFRG